ncbi:MAG: FmdB family transcriptional regulator [Armatimonadetes bacterium]|nr:FmdB family transcriptional regulator [Armatimonadota bacterium]
MPIYIYECRACSEVIEVQQRITEDSLTDCELCGAAGTLKKVMQPTAVMFKGSGFFINDSAPVKTEAKSSESVVTPEVPAVTTPAKEATPAPAPVSAPPVKE